MEISEAVSLTVDTFNRDDIEGFVAACTPDVEFRSLRGMIEDLVYRGHDEVRAFQRDSETAWSERRMEPLTLETREDEALLVANLRMRGRASGVLTERRVAFTIRLRDGLISHLALHEDAESARRELGWAP